MYFLLALLFARNLPFYLRLSRSFSRSFYRNSTVLVYSLTILRVFLDSLYVFYFLFFFFGRSVSFFSSYFHSKPSLHKLESKQFPPADNALALPVLLLCELIRICEILRITVKLQPHQFDFALKTRVANHFLTWLYIH